MLVKLEFVENIEEVTKSLQTFNAEASAHPDVVRSLLSQ